MGYMHLGKRHKSTERASGTKERVGIDLILANCSKQVMQSPEKVR